MQTFIFEGKMIDKIDFHLDIKTLPIGKSTLEYRLNDDYFEKSDYHSDVSGDILVEIEVDKQTSVVKLSVSIQGTVYVPCDRCLKNMSLDISSEQTINMKLESNGNLLNSDELDIEYHEGVIDIEPLLNEEILLSIPIRKVHPDGKCDKEMSEIFEKYSKNREPNDKKTDKAIAPTLAVCSHCGAMHVYHTVCPECGYYRGKLAIEKKEAV